MNYLIKNGAEKVVSSAREHLYDLRSLESFSFVDDNGKDQGVNSEYRERERWINERGLTFLSFFTFIVRHKVKEILEFVQDDDRVREERKKAKKNKDKFVGIPSDQIGSSFGGGGGGGGGGKSSYSDSKDKDKDTYFSNKSIPTIGTMNDLDDKDWTSNSLSIPEVFKTATNKIKTIFDKPFDAELPDDSSNRVESGDDDDHKYNDIEQDDDFSSSNKNSSNNSRRSTSASAAYKDNNETKSNTIQHSSNKPAPIKLNTNTNNKLKTIKIAPAAAASISKPPRPPTPPTEDLFKVDDEFGDFIPNTDQNFANFDNFEAKAATTTNIDDIMSIDIQPPQQKPSIDDLFSTLTVDTSTTTIKPASSSNIDDLFNNLNFSPQPPPQQQYQMPMSQTMPNIFQQQQINPQIRPSTVRIN